MKSKSKNENNMIGENVCQFNNVSNSRHLRLNQLIKEYFSTQEIHRQKGEKNLSKIQTQ